MPHPGRTPRPAQDGPGGALYASGRFIAPFKQTSGCHSTRHPERGPGELPLAHRPHASSGSRMAGRGDPSSSGRRPSGPLPRTTWPSANTVVP